MSKEEIQPYEAEPRQHGEGLWTWDGEWYGNPFKRRMTIARLASGGLFIHNAMRLRDEDYAKLEKLGRIEAIVVPNKFHDSDAHFYKLRYPSARLYVPRGAQKKVAALCPVDGTLPPPDTEAWSREIECLEFSGTRLLEEFVFLARAARTLILTDLVFNLPVDGPGSDSRAYVLLCRLNLIHGRFGPSRIFKRVFMNDRVRASASLGKILAWDFDRVIMNHGSPLESGGREAMRRGFAEIGVTPSPA
jgi:hypothetical protein